MNDSTNRSCDGHRDAHSFRSWKVKYDSEGHDQINVDRLSSVCENSRFGPFDARSSTSDRGTNAFDPICDLINVCGTHFFKACGDAVLVSNHIEMLIAIILEATILIASALTVSVSIISIVSTCSSGGHRTKRSGMKR